MVDGTSSRSLAPVFQYASETPGQFCPACSSSMSPDLLGVPVCVWAKCPARIEPRFSLTESGRDALRSLDAAPTAPARCAHCPEPGACTGANRCLAAELDASLPVAAPSEAGLDDLAAMTPMANLIRRAAHGWLRRSAATFADGYTAERIAGVIAISAMMNGDVLNAMRETIADAAQPTPQPGHAGGAGVSDADMETVRGDVDAALGALTCAEGVTVVGAAHSPALRVLRSRLTAIRTALARGAEKEVAR